MTIKPPWEDHPGLGPVTSTCCVFVLDPSVGVGALLSLLLTDSSDLLLVSVIEAFSVFVVVDDDDDDDDGDVVVVVGAVSCLISVFSVIVHTSSLVTSVICVGIGKG